MWYSYKHIGNYSNGATTLSLRKFFALIGPFCYNLSFNGAATLSLRKQRQCVKVRAKVNVASMGPQLYRCGNARSSGSLSTGMSWLQWGRNFIVAETEDIEQMKLQILQSFNGAATLSLRKHDMAADDKTKAAASMGPQLYRCGNTGSAYPRGTTSKLQWGRNFIVAETRLALCCCICKAGLQWGRNFIVAETSILNTITTGSSIGFNGAATLSLRKLCQA